MFERSFTSIILCSLSLTILSIILHNELFSICSTLCGQMRPLLEQMAYLTDITPTYVLLKIQGKLLQLQIKAEHQLMCGAHY